MTILAAGVAVVLLLLWIGFSHSVSRSFRLRQFERQVRNNIDPAKLQEWATNLLNKHPVDVVYLDRQGTNLPPELIELAGTGGYKRVVRTGVTDAGEACLIIFGGRGDPSIIVGATNLMYTNYAAQMWRSGIYFQGPVE